MFNRFILNIFYLIIIILSTSCSSSSLLINQNRLELKKRSITKTIENHVLIFISEDALDTTGQTSSIKQFQISNFLLKNVVLTLSNGLYKNFVSCNYSMFLNNSISNCVNFYYDNNQMRQNDNNNLVSNSQSSYLNKQVKILTYKLNSKLGIEQMNSLYNHITKIYYSSSTISSSSILRLNSIFLITNQKFLSTFNLMFKNRINCSVYYFDVNKFSQQIENKPLSKLALKSQFRNLNPTIESVFEIISYFKSFYRLENVNFYLASAKENLAYMDQKRKFKFINEIDNVNKLIRNLIKLNNLIINKHNESVRIRQNYVVNTDAKLLSSLKNIENFFFSNDLIILKCNIKHLYQILTLYNSLKTNYFNHYLTNLTLHRYLIWIPENDLNSFQTIDYKLILSKISQLCNLFRIYILNWILDVDSTVSKIIENKHSMNDFIQSGKFSLKLLSIFFLKNQTYCTEAYKEANDKPETEFYFKIKDDRIYLTDSSFYNEYSQEESFSYLKPKTVKKVRKPSHRPLYRIVSIQVEPFVIVSQLDDHLVSKDECKDGLPCLDIESDEILYNSEFKTRTNLTEEMNNIFNKELMIGLIKGFKYYSDERMQSKKTNLVKTKCCTGYMINLLQRLSDDLDFEFEFYFSPDKKYGSLDKLSNEWSGSINHVISRVAHIAAGPFSITEERAKYVDFSTPFLYSGYSLLVKQQKKGVDDLWMFLKPFTYLHWAVICLFALCSAFSLALLEFNSPFGLNPNGRQRARNYTLGSAISMVISLMFMHTMPAKSPKSWAGKWTQNFIASFALIFIATYTAKMASILSAGQEGRLYKGIDDDELLTLKRGYMQSSSIESHMCKNSKEFYKSHCKNSILLKSDTDGIKSVVNGSIDVYISDHLLLNYMRFKESDCDLHVTGQEFAVNGYALAMSKSMNQKEKNSINIQLLHYYETGYLDELYNKWFNKRVKCNRKPSDDKIRIDVYQYKGVFAYLGIGMLAAVLVLFIEQALYKCTIPFLRNKPKKSNWKSLKLMFISQRFYRIVHSEELYEASHSAKEFINVFKRRDFEAIFQKSFRKKQMESLHASQLRKRPKLWALIEASTEGRSKDLINRTSSSETSEEDNKSKNNPKVDFIESELKQRVTVVKFQDLGESDTLIQNEPLKSPAKRKTSDIQIEILQEINENEFKVIPIHQKYDDDDDDNNDNCENSLKTLKKENSKKSSQSSPEDLTDLDEQFFSATVSTPALEEPEFSDINSLASLPVFKSEIKEIDDKNLFLNNQYLTKLNEFKKFNKK